MSDGSRSYLPVNELMDLAMEDRDLYNHVLSEMAQLDPANLVLLGLGEEEYSIESAAICCRLEKGMTRDEISAVIKSEIFSWLDCKEICEIKLDNASRSIERMLEQRISEPAFKLTS